MSTPSAHCSFCGIEQTAGRPLIAGADGHICEACVRLAGQVIGSWGHKHALGAGWEELPAPVEMKRRLDEYVIGQDLAKEILCVAVHNHYKRLRHESSRAGLHDSENVEIGKSNILMLGPSGTGKTLLAATLAKIAGVPFAVADATTLTQAGYVGEDVENILARLLDVAEGNVRRAEWGMVYIDEIDKLARSPESAISTRDVSGEGVQQALLKLVEGTLVKLPGKGRKRGENSEEVSIDTRNILFIAGGAFSGMTEVVARRMRPKSEMGFHAQFAAHKLDLETILAETHPEDLRRFGLIPEFIGRFPVLAILENLDQDALVRILTEPRDALVKQYQKLFAYEDVLLEFTPAALRAIAAKALATSSQEMAAQANRLQKMLAYFNVGHADASR